MRRALQRLATRWSVDAPATDELPPTGRIGELWRGLAPYVGPSASLTGLLAFVSLLAGFAEAGLIFFLVRIASSLADADAALSFSVGPFKTRMDVEESFLAAGVALVVSVALNLVAAVLISRVSVSFLNRTRKRTMSAFLEAGWSVQSMERTGHLQELLSTHVSKISAAIYAITGGVNAALSFVALMISAIVIQPAAAAVLLAAVVVIGVALLPLGRVTKRRASDQASGNATYASQVAETVALAREVNAFGVSGEVARRLAAQADRVARASFITRLLVRGNPIIYQALVMALLLAGMASVHYSDAGDVAGLGAVVILLVRALAYTQQINGAMQQANEIAPYIEDLSEQMSAYASSRQPYGTAALGSVERLDLDHVEFEYESGSPVLRDINFGVDRGEVIGIVGPSGGGKSTLVQLLLRLREPTAGRYLVNGDEATAFDQPTWSRSFAFVPQENHLLRGTVRDNLALFRPLDDAALERAAALAHVHDEIEQLPLGYRTEIGSGAADLSGGQRQRLGLARALAGGPDVLVLDEPTSALDMRSETLVQQTLQELRGSLTMLIVAHRLSTLSVCDRILVIQDGRITAIGTFDELQQSSPFFRDAVALSRLPA